MRSKFAKRELPEEFYKDLDAMINLDTDAFREMLHIVAKQQFPGRVIGEKHLSQVASRYKVPGNVLTASIHIAVAILRAEDEGDKIEDILDDFETLNKISEKSKNDLAQKIALTKSLIYESAKKNIEEDAAMGCIFPTLRNLATHCSIAAKMNDDFDAFSDDPDLWEPEVLETYPVLVLRIAINKLGKTERETLALTPGELTAMINQLKAAQKDLEQFSKTMSVSRENSNE